MCLICTCLPPYSTRPFGNSLASGSIGTPKIGDPLESSLVSSQKQNREGVAGAKSGQYRATAESRLGCMLDIRYLYFFQR
ncbi:unnamed protein product [Malus baccata var. baccata]